MSRQLTRRLILGPIQLLAVAVLVFVLLAVAPGDPAENLARLHTPGSEPPRELVLAIRTELGLDDPAPVRFSRWLLAALQGDLGVSYRTGKPIAHDLLIRLPATVHLAAAALALGLAAAVPLGIAAALGPGSWPDRLGGVVSLAALTVPSYVLALLLVLVFAATLGWLPAFGSGSAAHMVLPSIALGASIIAQLYQLTRASLLEVLHEDYVRTATSKGLHPRTVVLRHAFRNALLPLVTLIATMTGHLLGGAVVVETIFGWPGLGKYAVDAVFLRDYPAVLGAVLYLTAVFVILGAALELVHSRSLLVGSVLLGAIVLVTTFAPILMPGDPTAVDLDRRLLPPGVAGLGTDHLGRDVAARLLYGARTTLGATAVLFSAVTLAGIAVGGIAGYRGGRVDTVLTGVTDIVLAFPGLVLAVAIAGTLGPGMHNLLLAVALVGWGNQARLVRALVLTERSKGYIEAARTMGATPLQVVRRHLVRNVANPLLALAAADLGRVITGLAGLSFLGLGAQPPTAEWGSMLNEARPFLQSHPHLLLFPALAICLTIAGCSLVGEGLRQVNDPRRH